MRTDELDPGVGFGNGVLQHGEDRDFPCEVHRPGQIAALTAHIASGSISVNGYRPHDNLVKREVVQFRRPQTRRDIPDLVQSMLQDCRRPGRRIRRQALGRFAHVEQCVPDILRRPVVEIRRDSPFAMGLVQAFFGALGGIALVVRGFRAPSFSITPGTEWAFDVMREYITHVHIKDTYQIGDRMRTVWLGTGVIDFRWVVASMEGMDYDGDYALEYEVHVEPPETGVAKWLDWFLKI